MFPAFFIQEGLFISLGIFALGAIGALLISVLKKDDNLENIWGNSFAIFGSFMGLLYAVSVILSNSNFSFKATETFFLFPINMKVDLLSAFFVFIISLVALLSSVYSIGYMRQFYGKYNIGLFGFFYNIFIASMMLVVTSNDALYFLVVWELMSLVSYFLVIFEHDHKENIKAGFLYFIMTHIATGGIILAFMLIYSATGSFDFDAIRLASANISPFYFAIISLLMLVGFGTKAGIIPLHIWLPEAHPAAPSQVSALMSGVMIKTGIFMIIRLFFDVIPSNAMWFGMLVLVLGAVSSLLGVLYAITEHDIKRLLAYHSVENIGIILMGLGSSLIFISAQNMTLAALAFAAALFHTMNHAIFKALLFLGAGSVVSATHTRNIEEYGGLIKKMPYTALFFLVGSVAISALPPFNGFASEWLTYQALFAGVGTFGIFEKSVFIFAIVSLAFTGGLAAACFVKAFGVTFLAKSRSHESENAKESDRTLLFGMSVLAFLCLALGVFSDRVVIYLGNITNSLLIFSNEIPFMPAGNGVISVRSDHASLAMMQIFILIVLFAAIAYFAVKKISGSCKERIYGTWDCGANLNPRMEITATSFSRSIISMFSGILKPTKQIDIEYHDANIRYFTKSSTVTLGIGNIYKSYIYGPVSRMIIGISDIAKRIQCGNINLYLLYIFMTIIILLIWVTK
ncbi:MAG: hydrogenase 4 subunit B [Candidatus Paceibacterota bacterium]|jgi:hydrogenase-4 component B